VVTLSTEDMGDRSPADMGDTGLDQSWSRSTPGTATVQLVLGGTITRRRYSVNVPPDADLQPGDPRITIGFDETTARVVCVER
jgi:hypothetical protein